MLLSGHRRGFKLTEYLSESGKPKSHNQKRETRQTFITSQSQKVSNLEVKYPCTLISILESFNSHTNKLRTMMIISFGYEVFSCVNTAFDENELELQSSVS